MQPGSASPRLQFFPQMAGGTLEGVRREFLSIPELKGSEFCDED
jgi:hypothetical protein